MDPIYSNDGCNILKICPIYSERIQFIQLLEEKSGESFLTLGGDMWARVDNSLCRPNCCLSYSQIAPWLPDDNIQQNSYFYGALVFSLYRLPSQTNLFSFLLPFVSLASSQYLHEYISTGFSWYKYLILFLTFWHNSFLSLSFSDDCQQYGGSVEVTGSCSTCSSGTALYL